MSISVYDCMDGMYLQIRIHTTNNIGTEDVFQSNCVFDIEFYR